MNASRESLSIGRLAAIVLLTNPGAVPAVVLPTVIGAFLATGMNVEQASRLGAIELFGSAVIVLFAPLLIARFDRRWLAFAALFSATAGQVLTLVAHSFAALLACRAAAGAGEGLIYAVAIGFLSSTPRPDQVLGFSVTANQIAATSLLILISWLTPAAPKTMPMLVLAVFFVFHFLLVWSFPPSVRQSKASMAAAAPTRVAWLPMLMGPTAMFLLSVTFGEVWPFVGSIAVANGIPAKNVALALSLSGFGGIGGGLLAASLGARIERVTAIVIAAVFFGLAIAALPTMLLPAAAPILMMFWTFSIPFYLSLLAEIDTTGKMSVVTSAMIAFGVSGGQILGGELVARNAMLAIYAGLGFLVCAFIIAMATMAAVRRSLAQSDAAR